MIRTMTMTTTMMTAATTLLLASTLLAQQPQPKGAIGPTQTPTQPTVQAQQPKLQVKLPDLKTNVAWVGGSGAGRTINLKIYNLGQGNSTKVCSLKVVISYYACCYGDGNYQEPQSYVSKDVMLTIPILAAGGVHQYQIPIPSGIDYRPFSARVYVDSGDEVLETNEQNNEYTLHSPIQPQ